ncbi:ynaI, partial [Symbiodinium necroappetens]
EEPPLLFPIPTYAVLLVKGQSARVGWQDTPQGSQRPVMYGPRSIDGNFYSFTFLRSCLPFLRAAEASKARASEALKAAKESSELQ